MRNWTINTPKMDKKSEEYIIWHLEQLINYGLKNEKIDEKLINKYLPKLSLDPSKKRFIIFLLSHA